MSTAELDTHEFIRLMERAEQWTLQHRDTELLPRAKALASKILQNPEKVCQISPSVWAQFVALLPFEQSITTLSDLSLVAARLLERIVTLRDNETESATLARDIIIARLNLLVRRDLHNRYLTPQSKDAINTVLEMLNGHNR